MHVKDRTSLAPNAEIQSSLLAFAQRRLCRIAAHCLPENMPTIIALIFASILICFPSHAIAAGGTSQYKPMLSYDNAELNGQDFSGKNLQTAVFTTAKLEDTNFSGADLTGVVISSSTLNRTNLHGANLTQGLLDQVRFVGADLSDAVFTEAMMLRSTFTDVNIAGADFTDAILAATSVRVMLPNRNDANASP